MAKEIYKIGLVIGVTLGIILTMALSERLLNMNPENKLGVDVTASVVGVILDSNDDCIGSCPGTVYPRDRLIIKIEDVKENNVFKLNYINLSKNDEVEVTLFYSARPAKIIGDSALYNQIIDEGEQVDNPSYSLSKPLQFVDGMVVYRIPSKEPYEKIRPAIKQGDKIKIKNLNPAFPAKEYEIVNDRDS